MATYKQVSYGSTGSEVTELQNLLKKNGYADLAADGVYGNKTQAAVKDFQQKNNLTVDGIAGDNTWGALYKTQGGSQAAATPTTSTPAQTQTSAPVFSYTPSDTVTQADALLQQQLAKKPGEYQPTWQGQLQDTIQKILNREKFSYDMNGDALYQQYKDQYVTQGKLASMDTMGQAAALTGGYGSSYAQGVGQQAYQAYLQKLNEVVPELYGMARDQYNQEGQALYDQASLLAGMDEQEYGRYQDKLNQYFTELNYLTENARYMSETEYQKALDAFNIKYGAYRDTVGDQQWQAQFDEAKRQYDEQMALTKSTSSGGSSGVGGGDVYDNGGDVYDNGGLADNKVIRLQEALGVTPNGKWGPESQAAAEKLLGTTEAKKAYNKFLQGGLRDTGEPDLDKSLYTDWDAGDWEGYFARIRQSEGKAAAQEELQYFTSKGLIPQNMITYAASGARGSQTGH